MPTYETFDPPIDRREYKMICEDNDRLWSVLKTCVGCTRFTERFMFGCEYQRHINLSGHCNQFGPQSNKQNEADVIHCGHCGGIEGEGEAGRCPFCGGP